MSRGTAQLALTLTTVGLVGYGGWWLYRYLTAEGKGGSGWGSGGLGGTAPTRGGAGKADEGDKEGEGSAAVRHRSLGTDPRTGASRRMAAETRKEAARSPMAVAAVEVPAPATGGRVAARVAVPAAVRGEASATVKVEAKAAAKVVRARTSAKVNPTKPATRGAAS